jgi:hypothetical protein
MPHHKPWRAEPDEFERRRRRAIAVIHGALAAGLLVMSVLAFVDHAPRLDARIPVATRWPYTASWALPIAAALAAGVTRSRGRPDPLVQYGGGALLAAAVIALVVSPWTRLQSGIPGSPPSLALVAVGGAAGLVLQVTRRTLRHATWSLSAGPAGFGAIAVVVSYAVSDLGSQELDSFVLVAPTLLSIAAGFVALAMGVEDVGT